jgi:hypothetical protein
MTELPDTFWGFLLWLSMPTTAGIVLSLALRNWNWYQSIKRAGKFILALLLSLIIVIGAKVLMIYIPGSPEVAPVYNTTWAFFDYWYPIVAQAVLVFVASNIWNDKYNKSLPVATQKSVFAKIK